MDINQSQLVSIIDSCSNGVAIVDNENTLIYSNQAFSGFNKALCKKAISCNQNTDFEGYTIRCKNLGTMRALYVEDHHSPASHSQGASDQLLRKMLDKLSNVENVFDSMVQAIHEITGWRWIFVTRFLNEKTVEVVSYWDTDKHAECICYELEGTPCEVLVQSKKFTMFTDVAKSFSEDEFLENLGARSYAGLIYYGRSQEPIGHITCMHDSNDVDYKFMEDVIKLSSLVVSSNLLLMQTQDELQSAVDQAQTDGLTQLQNRIVFEKICDECAESFQANGSDCCIGIIDLNNFKIYNDTLGHPKGDLLLRLFATELTKLGRANDQAFRLGGDEFALVLPEAPPQGLERVQDQFTEAQHRLSLMLDHTISASVGFAHLSEVGGDMHGCYELADKRMYENKAISKL
mgnify:CR=1 FL=1